MSLDLPQVSKQINWAHFRVRGLFTRARVLIKAVRQQSIMVNSDLPDANKVLSAEETCVRILAELDVMERRTNDLLDELYEAYRQVNPPKRDRRHK